MLNRIPTIKGLSVDFYEQWSGLFTDTAWTDFTVVHLAGEVHTCMGQVELEIGILGLNIRFVYVYDDQTEDRQIMNERIEEMFKIEEGKGKGK